MKNIRRIAISPGKIQTIEQLRAWARQALQLGAEALLVREQGRSLSFAKELSMEQIVIVRTEQAGMFPYIHHGSRSSARPDGHAVYGRSCHTLAELQAAEAAAYSYAFYSPIFPTHSHPEAEGLGLEALQLACSAVSIPIYALGGIDLAREARCLQAGAAGIAGISLFLSSDADPPPLAGG